MTEATIEATGRHEERCPTCGRFVPAEADGFYDFPPGGDQESYVVVYCDEDCASRKSPPAHYPDGPVG